MESTLYEGLSPETYFGLVTNILLLGGMSFLGGGVMWSLVFTLQLMNFLPLVDVPFPANALKLFTVFNFVNLDIESLEGSL